MYGCIISLVKEKKKKDAPNVIELNKNGRNREIEGK